jgi:hypothetical protein
MELLQLVIPDRCAAASPESITTVSQGRITVVAMDYGFLASLGPGTTK